MTPETALELAQAERLLARGRIMLAAGLAEDAGRAAYMAGFHAAQALIRMRTGRIARTHRGVQAEFARLARDEAKLDEELRRFLPRAYDLKTIADYETGEDATVPQDRAAAALDMAGRFVDRIAALLGEA